VSTALALSGTTPESPYNEASTWTEAPSIFDLDSTLGGLTSPEFSTKISLSLLDHHPCSQALL